MVCQSTFHVLFLYQFHPTNNLLYMFIGLVTCCYVLLPVVTSLEEKLFVKLVSSFTFALVSNPEYRIPCSICSLGLLRVVTSKLVSSFHFYVSFQPTNTLLKKFILGLLRVVTSLEKKCFVKLVARLHFYISFQPTNTLLHMSIGLVTSCYLLLHLQRRKRLSNQIPGSIFLLVFNPRVPCYICSLCLLRVVTCCYILE